MTGDSENLSNGAIASCTTASMAGTTLVASSHNVIPSIEPMTPERTLSPVGLRGAIAPRQTDDCEQGCLDLLSQTIDDFVNDSYEQVRQFSLPGNSRETYKAVFDSLGKKANEAGEADASKRSNGCTCIHPAGSVYLQPHQAESYLDLPLQYHQAAFCNGFLPVSWMTFTSYSCGGCNGRQQRQRCIQQPVAKVLEETEMNGSLVAGEGRARGKGWGHKWFV